MKPARRILSARSTALYHALPWLWLAAVGAVAWMLRGEMLPVLAITGAVPAAALHRMLGSLRRVSTDGHVLFVSAGRKEIAVPFSEIAEVRETAGGRRRAPTITLRLKTSSQLGGEIRFVPRMRWWPDPRAAGADALWASFSPAEEIRQRIGLTRRHGGTETS